MRAKYYLGTLLTLPLLPLLYVQGKRVRASVPKLPEAKDPEGKSRWKGATDRHLRLLALGESTIAGVGVATHAEGFTGSLAHTLAQELRADISWKVYARSGFTARQVRERILPSLAEQKADIVVIGLGGNDAFTLNHPARWRREIRQIIEQLRQRYPEALIAFCQMPPIKEFPAFTPLMKGVIGNLVEILGEELTDLTKHYPKVLYQQERIRLDTWVERFALDEPRTAFFSDGVHPSQLTYQTWAKDMARAITQAKDLIPLPNR